VLLRAGDTGLSVSQLRERLGIGASNLSHHLCGLISTGLVTQEREATTIICRANNRAIESLLGYLIDECCVDAASAKTLAGARHSAPLIP
jgi:ArsR family transcriptional regulator